MRQRIDSRGATPDGLQRPYALIQDDLERTEQILLDELRSHHPFVDRLARYGFRLGGKRLRPALVLLSAKACGELNPDHLLLAAAVEMIHTATLIHDDVLDEATIRRHLATVNAQWDNEASVLLGDYLFSRAICLASAVQTTYACRTLAEAARMVCEGELRQVDSRGNYELSEQEYFDIIAAKTSELCVCSCKLGSHYAGGDPAHSAVLAQYARHLGIAFQITDDILDLVGDERVTGKSLGTDLLKQKATLPLIRLLSQTGGSQRSELVAMLSGSGNHHRESLEPWFQTSDAIAYAQQKALDHIEAAKSQLTALPCTPARDALAEIAEFVVARKQ
jgi:octaprenyl-diphosphate synthase